MPTLALEKPELAQRDEQDNRLLHEQVREQLRIQCKAQGADTALPAIRELSRLLGVNAATVTRSLRDLEEEGLVTVVPRKGIFINTAPPVTVELLGISSKGEQLGPVSQRFFSGMHDVAGRDFVQSKTIMSAPLPDPDRYVQDLQLRRIAGVAVSGHDYCKFPQAFDEASFILELSRRVPLVLVGKPHRYLEMDCVYCDPRAQMRQWLNKCYEGGIRRFGYITSISDTFHFRERKEEFRQFLLDNSLHLNPEYVPEVNREDTDQAIEREKVRRVIEANPPVEAVVTSSTSHAAGLIIEAQRKGRVPGKDLKILSLRAGAEDAHVTPYADLILVQEEEVGRAAMQFLVQKIRAEQRVTEPQVVRLPGILMESAPDN